MLLLICLCHSPQSVMTMIMEMVCTTVANVSPKPRMVLIHYNDYIQDDLITTFYCFHLKRYFCVNVKEFWWELLDVEILYKIVLAPSKDIYFKKILLSNTKSHNLGDVCFLLIFHRHEPLWYLACSIKNYHKNLINNSALNK